MSREGWVCPKCGRVHSPDVLTCTCVYKSIGTDLYPHIPDSVVGICPRCGITLRNVMGYVCGDNNCPTGLGGVTMLLHS